MTLNPDRIRAQFPALRLRDEHRPRVYFDNPGGTQVPQRVIDRMRDYLIQTNANRGGAFRTSVESDAVLHEARAAMADFLNAPSPDEIVFGPNMTTLTFAISRSLAQWLKPGDEIVLTRMDHDANVSPWMQIAARREAVVNWLDFNPETYQYELGDLEGLLTNRTRLVAVNYASNAIGTINGVKAITEMAHAAGALVFVDAVQYVPHGPTDVRAIGCDFLTCSAYKFFGPHVGVLWGRENLLDRLPAHKVRPASPRPPGKFETGTQNHEGIAGVLGAIEYLEWVGESFGAAYDEKYAGSYDGRRLTLKKAMAALRAYEIELGVRLIEGLKSVPGLIVRGISESRKLDRRVPTVSFTLDGHHPAEIAGALAAENIYVWDGHYYAVEVVQRLGLAETGGMVRVGLVHYNTTQEIERLLEAIIQIS